MLPMSCEPDRLLYSAVLYVSVYVCLDVTFALVLRLKPLMVHH